MPSYKGQGGISGDFLESVKTRQKPFRDIELAINTMAVCHLGIISYQLKRSLKWDPVKEKIVGDKEASKMMHRPSRQPWDIDGSTLNP